MIEIMSCLDAKLIAEHVNSLSVVPAKWVCSLSGRLVSVHQSYVWTGHTYFSVRSVPTLLLTTFTRLQIMHWEHCQSWCVVALTS